MPSALSLPVLNGEACRYQAKDLTPQGGSILPDLRSDGQSEICLSKTTCSTCVGGFCGKQSDRAVWQERRRMRGRIP